MSLYRFNDGTWRSTLFDAEEWLDHAFGTARAKPRGACLELKQVHGTQVVLAEDHRAGMEGDGLISRTPGLRIAVKSADCIPLLVAAPSARAVAAVHAGWRGAAAGIAVAVVEKMCAATGAVPEELLVAAGGAIRACCFAVGPEVAIQFRPVFPEWDDLSLPGHVDLIEAIRRQLAGVGIKPGRMDLTGPCTCCGGDEFHSWRRDKRKDERMYAAIGIRETAGEGAKKGRG